MSVWRRGKKKKQNPVNFVDQQKYNNELKNDNVLNFDNSHSKENFRDYEMNKDPKNLSDIVDKTMNGLRGQGITADDFCNVLGFHKNTISKWRNGHQTPPEWIAFFFKILLIEIRKNTDMKEFIKNVNIYKI